MPICLVDPIKRKARLTLLSRCIYSYRSDRHQEDQARRRIRRVFALTVVAWVVLMATASSTFGQTSDPSSSFTDLSTDYDVSGQISVLPGSLTFASQVVGTTSASQIVTIKNPSNSAVNLLIALSGDADYVPYDTCIGSLAAGASCTISMKFRTTNTGFSNGTLTITDLNDGYSQSVALTGSGTQQSSPPSNIALSSSVGSLQVTAAGEAATSDVYISPQNGFQGQVNLQCKIVAGSQEGSAASPVCSLSTSQVTISGGNDSSSELSVSTQTTGAITESGPFSSRRRMSLAALAALCLLPLGRRRKRIYAGLSLLLVVGMIGCSSVPNTPAAISATPSNSYTVLVTATSGAQSTSISIPLEVK